MAVYEKTYRPYTGPTTPEWSRFLVIPRYAAREIFRTRLLLAYFVLCLVWPLSLALYLYLPHNLEFITTFGLAPEQLQQLLAIEPTFFRSMVLVVQGFLAFLMTFIVAPSVVAPDLANNGMALYLSRPFSRLDYVLGKMTVLFVLLSLITWIPAMLLFFWQSYLGGWEWLGENLRVGAGLFVGSVLWIVVLCLVGLAASAYFRWKPMARGALIVLFFVPPGVGGFINLQFRTDWGAVLSPFSMAEVVWSTLLGLEKTLDVPAWTGWAALLTWAALALLLLSRKIRAYEVVRS